MKQDCLDQSLVSSAEEKQYQLSLRQVAQVTYDWNEQMRELFQ